MAKLFLSEYETLAKDSAGRELPITQEPFITSQVVPVGAETKSSAFDARTRIIAFTTDTDCSFLIGENPTADTDDFRIRPGVVMIKGVQPGHKISVIAN